MAGGTPGVKKARNHFFMFLPEDRQIRRHFLEALAVSVANLSLAQTYQPSTFLERGVAMPFTTPLLAGARVRPGKREGLEVILPNPAGGRGVYILPWAGVRELCRPTVHDARLQQLVSDMKSLTPRLIRGIARQVATEGLAGREAQDAAALVSDTDQQDQMIANFQLLMALVEQVAPDFETGNAADTATDRSRLAELEDRAKKTIADIAPRIGWAAETVAAGLEELGGIFMGIGMGVTIEQARIPRLLKALTAVQAETAIWAEKHDDESGLNAGMVAAVAGVTVKCAHVSLAEARTMAQGIPALLREWGRGAGRIGTMVGRSDWLMDGWEQICVIWRAVQDTQGCCHALDEMAMLVPVLPREAAEWYSAAIETDPAARFRRSVSLNQDWRTGAAVFDQIARNEQRRAQAA